MEDVVLKYPLVARQIFEYLDDKSLANCRRVSSVLCQAIDRKKVHWTRMIRNYIPDWNQIAVQTLWNQTLKRISTETDNGSRNG